jgi:hypothetical protein
MEQQINLTTQQFQTDTIQHQHVPVDTYHQHDNQQHVYVYPQQNLTPGAPIPPINPSDSAIPLITTGIPSVHLDHNIIKANIEQLLSMDSTLEPNKDAKQRLLNDTIALISQHDVAEEVVIYRSVRKIEKSKSKPAKIQLKDLEKILYDIDKDYGSSVENPNFNSRLKTFETAFLQHIAFVETGMIPIIESHHSPEDLEKVNNWYGRVKKLAPSRPHPDGPHSTAGQIAAGPALSFVDMMRDLGKKFTK